MTETPEREEVIELAKRRGYLYPSFEIYGGASGFWDYGPLGASLKKEVVGSWRDMYVVRHGYEEIDATTVGKEDVYVASGHAEGFADALAACHDCGTFFRADHLVEDHTDIENADGMALDRLADILADENVPCPSCGATLEDVEVEESNLMFETNIGPGRERRGYLRPETAQGIFVDFQRLKRYYREALPFGVTQVGRAYRNEINPRQGIVRLREFQQAELEYFKKPEDEIDISPVEDVEVRLYPVKEQQDDDGEAFVTTVGEAVEDGIIDSPTIAYFVGRSQEWYESIGIDPEKLRFRQHLLDERAHYASDCWDGETLTTFGWIEVNGVADRSDYDLRKHAEHSGEEMGVWQEYDETVVGEETVADPDMSVLGPEFGGAAGGIADALREKARDEPEVFEEADDEVEVKVEGETYTVPLEATGFERRETHETGENVLPQVVEPSYGLDRIVYSVIEHSYDEDVVDEEERTVLRLPPNVAPFDAAVFPLVSKDGLEGHAREIEDSLRDAGLCVKYDGSGAIGRRYRRHDEIGTPIAVTVDYDTKDDGTVTVRDRDSTEQKRVPKDEVVGFIRDVVENGADFEDA
jgi:glycyl-tRNA synthetase